MAITHIKETLSALKVDRSSGHPKPHKVCLLLAVINLIQQGKITNNRIQLDDALEQQFLKHIEKFKKGNDSSNINMPFYHLQSDGFWHFQFYQGGGQLLTQGKGTPSKAKIKQAVEYVSLDQEIYLAFQNPMHAGQCKEALLENLEDLSEQFHRWLLQTGRSEKTAKNYIQAIRGSISNWAHENNISRKNLMAVTGYSHFHHVAENIAGYEAFKAFDKRGKGMYSDALNNYKAFLADTGQVYVNQDIDNILQATTISNTEKAQLVKTRIGQGRYREKLINYWQGCAVTKYPATQLLVASHIKPWRASNNEERLSTYNGILLLPNIDKAFDLGYISFEESGQIILSAQLETPDKIGINPNMHVPFAKEHLPFLEYHRGELLK